MATLFTVVLAGMEDNNNVNQASFSDWDDAAHAIEVYGGNYKGEEPSPAEMAATVEALNRIIRTNGVEYDEAVRAWNIAVWGQNFRDNNGSSPFGG